MKQRKWMAALLTLVILATSVSTPVSTPGNTAHGSVTAMKVYAAEGEVALNKTNFPDPDFREYCREEFDTDGNGALSAKEISKVKSVNLDYRWFSSLQGIEYFTALQSLSCRKGVLEELDVSKNTALTSLNCYSNRLTKLNVSKNTALKELICCANQLSALDVSKNTALTELDCMDNQIEKLDVSKNTALSSLTCGQNAFNELDVSKNTALTYLDCWYSQFSRLDVSKNTALKTLNCSNNQLSDLDISKNTALETLNCSYNELSSLDLSKNTNLKKLYCSGNQFTKLALSENTALEILNCSYNQIRKLDTGKNVCLETLYCVGNQLTKLNISGNVGLKNLYCGNNQLTELNLSKNTALVTLNCDYNQLVELDCSKNTNLNTLSCERNGLAGLDISGSVALRSLTCKYNKLREMDCSKCTELTSLFCYGNKLTTLNVTKNTKLSWLDCSENRLTSLDVSNCKNLWYWGDWWGSRCDDNVYYIGEVTDTYDLTQLPDGFDVNRTSDWVGADCNKAAKTLSNITSSEITYTYDCGNEKTAVFKLITADEPSCVGPQNVKAVGKKAGQLAVTWDAVNGAKKYAVLVYQNGDYRTYTDSVTKTSYTIKGLKANTTYEIVVRAFVDGEWSDYSAADHVKGTTSTKPANVKVKAKGKTKLLVSWDAVPGATKYAVSIYENGEYHTYTRSKKGKSYKIKGLKANTTYEVLVQAYVDGKWSSYTVADHVKGKTKK